MANCTYNNSTLYTIDLIGSKLDILSLVMCTAAITILIYYKLYHSFNYRLILYLLISFLINAIADNLQPPLVWYHFHLAQHQYIADICAGLASMKMYSMWNIQLSVGFLIAEVFSMVVFSVELQKVEVPLTLACFMLPNVVAILSWYDFIVNDNSTIQDISFYSLSFLKYNAISGMVMTGISVVAIATAMSYLAYCSLQSHFISRNDEEQYLLYVNEHARRRYQSALKESLPLSVYPITVQLSLLMYYLNLIKCTVEIRYIYVFIGGSIGSVASTIFFIHIKALGRRRRNKFRNKSHITVPSNTVEPINEGQRVTEAGSITGTHVTDFDPPGESDIEPNTANGIN